MYIWLSLQIMTQNIYFHCITGIVCLKNKTKLSPTNKSMKFSKSELVFCCDYNDENKFWSPFQVYLPSSHTKHFCSPVNHLYSTTKHLLVLFWMRYWHRCTPLSLKLMFTLVVTYIYLFKENTCVHCCLHHVIWHILYNDFLTKNVGYSSQWCYFKIVYTFFAI